MLTNAIAVAQDIQSVQGEGHGIVLPANAMVD